MNLVQALSFAAIIISFASMAILVIALLRR